MLTPAASFNLSDKHQCQQLITTIELCGEELYSWDELPESLLEFMQAQEGLRIDQCPIDSRKEAETAYRLLHCKGSPECLSIIGLVFSILIVYGWAIRRIPRRALADLMILGGPPKDIVPRVCSACGGRVLDDSFPYYAKNNLDFYVVRSSQTGCGLIDCKGGHILLHPLSKGQRYVRALTETLAKIPNPRVRGGAPWENYFLRHGKDEIGELPLTVEVRCPSEGCKGTLTDEAPRWTIHPTPTVVVRQFKCPGCRCKSNFKPTDVSIEYITSESLSRTWSRFKEKGCDLTQYPRRADVYFSNSHITIRIAQLKEIKRLADQHITK